MRHLVLLVLALGSIGTSAAEEQVVKVDGSSTVFPILEAAGHAYQKHSGNRVTIGLSGTGGGFKKFCDGQTDVQNASRPISKVEMQKCAEKGIKYLEIPVAYDALVVVVNSANTWAKSITTDELKKIWEPAAKGVVKTWKQVNSNWPDVPLKLYGPGTDSGTFDYFTEAIVGTAKSSRPDYTASEDDNVLVTGVANDKGGLGYFGYAYYIQNKGKIRALEILGGAKAKAPVAPSPESVKDASYFPLSRPLFIYVSESSLKSKKPVYGLIDFLLDNGAKMAEKAKYIPLPETAYVVGKKHLKEGKLGTVFAGESKVGLKVEDLLKLESKL